MLCLHWEMFLWQLWLEKSAVKIGLKSNHKSNQIKTTFCCCGRDKANATTNKCDHKIILLLLLHPLLLLLLFLSFVGFSIDSTRGGIIIRN